LPSYIHTTEAEGCALDSVRDKSVSKFTMIWYEYLYEYIHRGKNSYPWQRVHMKWYSIQSIIVYLCNKEDKQAPFMTLGFSDIGYVEHQSTVIRYVYDKTSKDDPTERLSVRLMFNWLNM
jgi:hypothetical protein